ncbi:Ser/Thr protein phosphatase [Histomonas meleagridis]|uniref:Ser/Thr protein phosphatase n=1 Tax=Histomonas meleagridis TaxID=135588 RepID=UPI0035595199|nr:Ser/Thr protein phosphatase [Histomonas meleagridis]KAH0803539.1 Ser/Thr protein phosphatase [Histomonas meleagridis]
MDKKRQPAINTFSLVAASIIITLPIFLKRSSFPIQKDQVVQNTEMYEFLYINDIHLDPSYIPNGNPDMPYFCNNASVLIPSTHKYGQYNCDTPNETYQSMIQNIPKIIKKPQFIICGGDIPGHSVDSDFDSHIAFIKKLLDQMGDMYPDVPLLLTLGNNDFYQNYGSLSTDERDFLGLTNITRLGLQGEHLETFKKGGYYYYDFEPAKIRFLLLNTVMYTTKRSDSGTDPHDQFSWMERVISEGQSKGLTIIITMHIPPGHSDLNAKQGWHEEYISRFDEIVKKYDVKYSIAAHTHYDIFMPHYGQTGASQGYSLSSPSVSPAHNNNPGFRVYQFNENGLIDYEQYFADIMMNPSELNWELEYKFSQAYNVTDLSSESIQSVVKYITTTSEGKWSYKEKVTALAMDNWKFYFCMLKATTHEQAEMCLGALEAQRIPITPYDE